MKIISVNIPKDFQNNGIDDIEMQKLGSVVLLAGKNGSGKSRIMEKIRLAMQNKRSESVLRAWRAEKTQLSRNIQNAERRMLELREPQYASQDAADEIQRQSDTIISWKKSIAEVEDKIRFSDYLTCDEAQESYVAINFVPKVLELQDPARHSQVDNVNAAHATVQLGTNSLHQGTLAKLQVIQDNYFNATHPESSISDEEKRKVIETYKDLNELIFLVLGEKLTRDTNGLTCLFGFPVGQARFSDGQKILLQFCVALFSQRQTLDKIVLLMDEPENHLHPEALIDVVNKISKALSQGQIWISTHSIPLLAHFNPSAIWYVEKNKISYCGNTPARVLKGLIGEDDEISKLQDFLNLPAQFATNVYSYECLFSSPAVETGKADPQGNQIRNYLDRKLRGSNVLKVLDFGAGKGRLLRNIIDNVSESPSDVFKTFNYVAFDNNEIDKSECINTIGLAYEIPEGHYYNTEAQLLSEHDKESFDIVILCNVLHEIEPKKWLTLFKKDGLLSRLLKPGGDVLIVEDQLMPHGEKAYQNGFIVLDTPQIKELFQVKTEEDQHLFMVDSQKNGRLKAHALSRQLIERISAESRKKALRSLSETAKINIATTRERERTYLNGKSHAFWVHQFANASLALDEE